MRLLLILVAVAAVLIPVPVLAFDPPGQSSDNATDVIIWHSGNLTVDSVNISVVALEDALVAAAEAQAETINEGNSDIAADYLILVIVTVLVALVFWQRTIFLYAVGTVVTIVYGLSLAQPDAELSLWIAGVAIAIIGTSFLYRIIMIAYDWVRRR